jgi:hypothetical protein
MKTNAVRILDRLGVRYELREYEVDPNALAAETVARKVGLPREQVFKTLVARGDKQGVCLAVVSGNCELDLKALARATGEEVEFQAGVDAERSVLRGVDLVVGAEHDEDDIEEKGPPAGSLVIRPRPSLQVFGHSRFRLFRRG